MPERSREVRTKQVEYWCDECGRGVMRSMFIFVQYYVHGQIIFLDIVHKKEKTICPISTNNIVTYITWSLSAAAYRLV